MMKKTVQIAAILLPVCILFLGSRMHERKHFVRIAGDPIIEFPENIKKIIDNKCYGCHNTESKAILAKGKLSLDNLAEMEKSKLIGKLDNIIGVLEDGSMPPSKFLKQNPDAGLSEEESQLLKEWAEKTSDDLLK